MNDMPFWAYALHHPMGARVQQFLGVSPSGDVNAGDGVSGTGMVSLQTRSDVSWQKPTENSA